MTDALPTSGGYAGQEWLQSHGGSLNAIDFVVRRVMGEKAFTGMVKVMGYSNTGPAAPIGTVTLQPMVHQSDGLGNLVPHGPIYNLPYLRVQAGGNALICDPVAGDIGVAVFCDRDTSAVQATGAPAGPGSNRRNDWQDGIYLGCIKAATPTTYISINQGTIAVVSPNAMTISTPNCTLDAAGNLTVTGGVKAGTGGADSVTLQHHTHSGGLPPTAGT